MFNLQENDQMKVAQVLAGILELDNISGLSADEIYKKAIKKSKKIDMEPNMKIEFNKLQKLANNVGLTESTSVKEYDIDNDLPEDELDDWIDNVDLDSDNGFIDVFGDDDDIIIIDPITGEVIDDADKFDEQLDERVLSRAERIKAKINFLKSKAKRSRSLKLKLRRKATPEQIKSRARKLAIKMVKEKIIKKPLNQFSVSDKEKVERMLPGKKTIIDRLALKLIPRIRDTEKKRLTTKDDSEE